MEHMVQRQLNGKPTLHLADKIPPKVHTIFVGINPAIKSAQVGHYYAHHSNLFWRLLSQSGIAPGPLEANDDDHLVTLGFGFTDVAKRPTAHAAELASTEFQAARQRLLKVIRERKPRTVVFVSKRSARAFLQVPDRYPVKYGPQEEKIGDTTIWFLPSTSGQSRGDSSFEEKLAEFIRLAEHVQQYSADGRRPRRPPTVRGRLLDLIHWPRSGH